MDLKKNIENNRGKIEIINEEKVFTPNLYIHLDLPKYDNLAKYVKYNDNFKPNKVYLRIKRDGEYKEWTFKEFKNNVYNCAKSLIKLGLTAGCGTNINSYNNPEWLIAYYGSVFGKFIPTGVYTTSSSEQCEYFYKSSKCECVFVEDEERLQKYIQVKENLIDCKAIVLMESNSNQQFDDSKLPFKVYKWNDFLEIGNEIDDSIIDVLSESIKPEDTLTLIFTSGTTSLPKACEISHRNMCYLSLKCLNSVVIPNEIDYSKIISYLPLSHIAEQMFSLCCSCIGGVNTTFGDRNALKGSLLQTVLDVRPTYFLGVPRVYEKMQAKIQGELNAVTGLKKHLIDWALRVGLENGKRIEKGEYPTLSFQIANTLVYKKLLKTIGFDQCKRCLSGAAPISNSTMEFFTSINCKIFNAYGLSETTGPCVMETPVPRLGSAGRILGGQSKIAPDGEILLKGDFIFKGYLNNQEATKEVIDQDGWLHTGDIGQMDDDGYIFITDRKKEIIITAGGENISPSLIEGSLRLIPGVDQGVVIGDKQKFLVCLITVNLEFLKFLKSKNSYPYPVPETYEDASKDENLNSYINEQIKSINKGLAQVQTIKRFKILPNEFKDEDELTSTKKLKRRIINEKYQKEIKELYGDLYTN